MVAHDKKLLAQAVAAESLGEVEKLLADMLEYGYGEVNLKISVNQGIVTLFRTSVEKTHKLTLKPSLN